MEVMHGRKYAYRHYCSIRKLEDQPPHMQCTAMQSIKVRPHDLVSLLIRTGRSRHTVSKSTNKTTQAKFWTACIVAHLAPLKTYEADVHLGVAHGPQYQRSTIPSGIGRSSPASFLFGSPHVKNRERSEGQESKSGRKNSLHELHPCW